MIGILQFGLAVVGGGCAVALWFYATGGRRASIDATTGLRIDNLERRMDDGGRRSSDLTSKILILPAAIEKLDAELVRLRTEVIKLTDHVSDLRVATAQLKTTQTLQQGNGLSKG